MTTQEISGPSPGGDAAASLTSAKDGKILTSAAGGGVRWRPGERLEYLFEERSDASGGENELAVDGPCGRLTCRELDARTNRLARFLAARPGFRSCERGGLPHA